MDLFNSALNVWFVFARLYLLIKAVGGVSVKEFSSGLHVARRDAIINKFAAGKIDM